MAISKDGWLTIVVGVLALAVSVTPGVQRWWLAVPLWLLTLAVGVRWFRRADDAVRPRVLIQYDIPFLWDKAPVRLGEEQPFVVTNSGPPARNVAIGPINIDDRHRAVFDEISAVHEGQPVPITPNIEQDRKLYGGIFQRNLRVTLQGFVDQRSREGAKYLALPFAATYRDFDGREYTTKFELQIMEPMLGRVRVEKIGDVTA